MTNPKMEAIAYYSEVTMKLYKVRLAKQLIIETARHPLLAQDLLEDSVAALDKLETELHQKATNASKQLPSIYFEDESKL